MYMVMCVCVCVVFVRMWCGCVCCLRFVCVVLMCMVDVYWDLDNLCLKSVIVVVVFECVFVVGVVFGCVNYLVCVYVND